MYKEISFNGLIVDLLYLNSLNKEVLISHANSFQIKLGNEIRECVNKLSGWFNPFTSRSDYHVNSPYNFNTLSSRQVMRIKKIIN